MPGNSLPRWRGRVRVGAAALLVVLLTACQAHATTSPESPAATASASASPIASTSGTPAGPLVVVSNPVDQVHYSISLIDVDGRTVARASAAYGDQKPVPFPGSAAGGSRSGMANPLVQPIALSRLLPAAGRCCAARRPLVCLRGPGGHLPGRPRRSRSTG